jgi:hypothetical protein
MAQLDVFKEMFGNDPAYPFWVKYEKKLHKRWAEDFLLFKQQCFSLRENEAKYLNRKNTSRKIGIANFFWSNHTEHQHLIFDKTIDILVINEGITRKAAKEKASLMSHRRRKRLVDNYNAQQAKDYNKRFFSKYAQKEEIKTESAKSIILPTNALYSLARMLETQRYDETGIEFIFTKDTLRVKLKRLPKPLIWNNEVGDWDL